MENIINFNLPDTPLTLLPDPYLIKKRISLFVKRLDRIDPLISGNKWFKLKYNLIEATKGSFDTLLTFGGAYSNHIYATAAAGKKFGFKTIGIIRGEAHHPLNSTLKFADACGMKLFYVNRTNYRMKEQEAFIENLKNQFGRFYLIPEGGTNLYAVKGCSEIPADVNIKYDFITTPCGTGGTLAGLITGLKNRTTALGFSVLKGSEFLNDKVSSLLANNEQSYNKNWKIFYDYHFGGYAKVKPVLMNFIKTFESVNKIKLEPVYSGKMFYGIFDLIEHNYFPEGSVIVALHTGGLQGLKGFIN